MNAVHHEIGMKRIYDLLVFPKAKGPVVKAEFAADQKMQSAAVFFLQGARGLKIERNIDLVFGFAFDLYALLGIIIIYVFADPVIGNPFGSAVSIISRISPRPSAENLVWVWISVKIIVLPLNFFSLS